MDGWVGEQIRRGIIDIRMVYSSREAKCGCGVDASGDGVGVEGACEDYGNGQ